MTIHACNTALLEEEMEFLCLDASHPSLMFKERPCIQKIRQKSRNTSGLHIPAGMCALILINVYKSSITFTYKISIVIINQLRNTLHNVELFYFSTTISVKSDTI